MFRSTASSFHILFLVAALSCGGNEPEAAPPKPLSIPNGRVIEGALVGGQPTNGALEAAAREGYKTIINMRGEGEPGVAEERARVEGLGMTYVWLPIDGTASLSEQTARAFDEALANAEGKVMVHCASGNRIGAIYALREHYVRGASPADALAFGKRAGLTRLAPAVREILGVN